MFPWEVLKGTTFYFSGIKGNSLNNVTTSALVRFSDNTTTVLSVSILSSLLGTFYAEATTATWVVGPCVLEITYTTSAGSAQTQKFPFNLVDPTATVTQTSFVNNDTKIIVSKR